MNSLFRFSDLSKTVEKGTLSVGNDIITEAYSNEDLNDIALLFQTNDLVSFLTKGKYSLYTLASRIIADSGPGELSFCTWGLSEPPLRALFTLKEKGLITNLYAIVDHRVSERQPKAFQFFTGIVDDFGYAKSHAKGYFFKTETQHISIITTGNVNRNTKNEFGTIIKGEGCYNLYQSWIQENLQMNKDKK
jgi:hypothetical protein